MILKLSNAFRNKELESLNVYKKYKELFVMAEISV